MCAALRRPEMLGAGGRVCDACGERRAAAARWMITRLPEVCVVVCVW